MPSRLHWLSADDPPDEFPDLGLALDDPNGLLAVGGDLSVPRLLSAYRAGIFPWYQDDQPILWWSPDPRAVLFPNELHVSRSLRRTIRKNRYTVSIDHDFSGVISACAASRSEDGTWITADMAAAYKRLHEEGHAHAAETWLDGELVGGLYGVNIGRVFFGESMFSRRADASKVALVQLVCACRELGIRLIDCQIASSHLASLGSRQISRKAFGDLLHRYTAFSSPSKWARPAMQTAELLALMQPN
jgi:leucyl/phenylalanyl-tRNA--protein transferase